MEEIKATYDVEDRGGKWHVLLVVEGKGVVMASEEGYASKDDAARAISEIRQAAWLEARDAVTKGPQPPGTLEGDVGGVVIGTTES